MKYSDNVELASLQENMEVGHTLLTKMNVLELKTKRLVNHIDYKYNLECMSAFKSISFMFHFPLFGCTRPYEIVLFQNPHFHGSSAVPLFIVS